MEKLRIGSKIDPPILLNRERKVGLCKFINDYGALLVASL